MRGNSVTDAPKAVTDAPKAVTDAPKAVTDAPKALRRAVFRKTILPAWSGHKSAVLNR